MSKIEKLVLDKYKEPVAESDELVNAEKFFNGNYTKIENKINEVIDNIDTRLNTLESDNTQNKQNILSIQQEQINQNSNISQNKTDIELLEENLSDEITTEEAESLTVKDAVHWYGKLDVSGNSVQESRSGKNKFDVSKVSTTITDKIIDTKTGTIQLNVSTDTGANATAVYLCELKPNTNYKIVYTYEGNKAGFGGTINNYIYNNESGKYEYLNNLKKITTSDSGKVQINLIGCQGAIPTTNYCKWSGLMLLEEMEDETFEEFGAMPSPSCLAEIQNCGDNVNVFNKEAYKDSAKYTETMEGSYTSYKGLKLQLLANTTYTLSEYKNNFIWVGGWMYALFNSTKNSRLCILQNLNLPDVINFTFTTDNTGIVYLAHLYGSNEKLEKLFNEVDIKIEKRK